ncbi:MAG: hypothetical protein KAR87_02445 [Candidatus Aenigmarchaeota archaeon]|nr:hypothetical protein [Candidatus Aenigmarchaeota archaeon]
MIKAKNALNNNMREGEKIRELSNLRDILLDLRDKGHVDKAGRVVLENIEARLKRPNVEISADEIHGFYEQVLRLKKEKGSVTKNELVEEAKGYAGGMEIRSKGDNNFGIEMKARQLKDWTKFDWKDPGNLFENIIKRFKNSKKIEIDKEELGYLDGNTANINSINEELGEVVPEYTNLKSKWIKFFGEDNEARLNQLKKERQYGFSKEDLDYYYGVLQNKETGPLNPEQQRKRREYNNRMKDNLGDKDYEEYRTLVRDKNALLPKNKVHDYHYLGGRIGELLRRREEQLTGQRAITSKIIKKQSILEEYKKQYIKGFLNVEYDFLKHNTGFETCFAMSQLRDILITELYTLAVLNMQKTDKSFPANPPMAILVFGGCGRREVSPFSDVDIFFLFFKKGEVPEECELVRDMVCNYMRLIGHGMEAVDDLAIRGLQGVEDQSDLIKRMKLLGKDVSEKSKYNGCRYICGDKNIWNSYNKLQDEYLSMTLEDGKKTLENLDSYLRQNAFTDIKHEEEWKYNIKKSSEGLRTIQVLCWALKGICDIRKRSVAEILDEAMDKNAISHEERGILIECYDFNLKLRNEIHYLYMKEHEMLLSEDLKKRSEGFGKQYKLLLGQLSSHFDRERKVVGVIAERIRGGAGVGETDEELKKKIREKTEKCIGYIKSMV